MIIECVNCNKKFDVNSELIPSTGRTIQCGSCNHVWFFNPSVDDLNQNFETKIEKKQIIDSQKIRKIQKIKRQPEKSSININKRNYELTTYKSKSNFSLSKFLSYIIVTIISFIAIIIIIDTFKSPIYKTFPNFEIVIFSLFELLKDIKLFIKDLI